MQEIENNDQEIEKMFKKQFDFVAGAQNLSQIPDIDGLSEFAFVGRSNVGKSSIINALTNRKSLARVSSHPGCTRQINFFKAESGFILVDLPGYGYAKISAQEREHWSKVIMQYIRGRVELKRIFLLIDARHSFKESDIEIMKLLDDCGLSYQITFTKIDKITQNDVKKLQEDSTKFFNKHPAMYPQMIYTSSNNKKGIEDLRHEIIKALNQ